MSRVATSFPSQISKPSPPTTTDAEHSYFIFSAPLPVVDAEHTPPRTHARTHTRTQRHVARRWELPPRLRRAAPCASCARAPSPQSSACSPSAPFSAWGSGLAAPPDQAPQRGAVRGDATSAAHIPHALHPFPLTSTGGNASPDRFLRGLFFVSRSLLHLLEKVLGKATLLLNREINAH
jgi:hypothetical protein